MGFRKFGVLMLGLGIVAGWARGSITYQTSQANFTSQATVTDGLTVSSLITFTGALTELAGSGVANDEYIDLTTGVEFLAFSSNGLTHEAFASVSGGILNTAAGQGDSIEVMFPSGVDYGFAFNFTTASSTGDNLCVDTSTATFSTCASGGTSIAQNGSGFIGALNDSPTPAPLVAVWLHPQSGSPGTDLQSFDVATQSQTSDTPEARTMVLIGSGLIVINLLRRRQKTRGMARRQASDQFA
jgi:hypothetical protein